MQFVQCYIRLFIYFRPELEIEGQFELPKQINKLLFIQAKNINNLSYGCSLFERHKPICKIVTAGVDILHMGNFNYVIKWSPLKDITSGEVRVMQFKMFVNI